MVLIGAQEVMAALAGVGGCKRLWRCRPHVQKGLAALTSVQGGMASMKCHQQVCKRAWQ